MSTERSKVSIETFPLLYVYAIFGTINVHLKRLEELMGDGTCESFRGILFQGYVLQAESELVKPLETFELSRKVLMDDDYFKEYIPAKCYPTRDFRLTRIVERELKKIARELGVPKKHLTAKIQNAVVLNTLYGLIARFDGIHPTVDTEKWSSVEWLQYIADHPLAPQRALILAAMESLNVHATTQTMGVRLASLVGHNPKDDPPTQTFIMIDPDDDDDWSGDILANP